MADQNFYIEPGSILVGDHTDTHNTDIMWPGYRYLYYVNPSDGGNVYIARFFPYGDEPSLQLPCSSSLKTLRRPTHWLRHVFMQQ